MDKKINEIIDSIVFKISLLPDDKLSYYQDQLLNIQKNYPDNNAAKYAALQTLSSKFD